MCVCVCFERVHTYLSKTRRTSDTVLGEEFDLFSDGERVRLLHDSVDMRRKSDFSESGCLGHLYL